MSNVKIDPTSASGLGYHSEDFLCSPAMVTAPLGGYNEYSVDCTVLLNLPPCCCSECGGANKMVALWAYPHRIPYLKSQGYQPIPDYCFHNDYNGGRPIIPSDPTAKLRDGLMVREPGACEVVALWTTCSNDRRCKENEAHAAQERILGRSVRNQGVIDGAVTSADQIWQKNNITPYEEDVVTSGFAQAPGKQNGRPLAAKMPA